MHNPILPDGNSEEACLISMMYPVFNYKFAEVCACHAI